MATNRTRNAAGGNTPPAAAERYSRLYKDLRKPAFAMVRRAFRSAFGEAEIEDIYSSAWLGTLRALRRREDELDDDELRRYLLTAVANHASKELRRRGRRPTAPLEEARAVADASRSTPEELTTDRESTREARDVLASMPARRRAILMLRYGWGLTPSEVCALVDGLSPRAYRREITQGVKEIGAKLAALERGELCTSRESALRAYVAGVATEEQTLQATSHLDHCHRCSEFVGSLVSSLHDASGALVWTGAAAAIGGSNGSTSELVSSVAERAATLGAKLRERLPGVGGDAGAEIATGASQLGSSGGARGAGMAGAGILAQLAGVGAAGKAAIACVGTGVAATACVAAGVVPPIELPGGDREPEGDPPAVAVEAPQPPAADPVADIGIPALPEDPAPDQGEQPGASEPKSEAEKEPKAAPSPAGSLAPAAPPEEHEFGLAGAAAASGGGSGSRGTRGSSGGSGGKAEAVTREFGP